MRVVEALGGLHRDVHRELAGQQLAPLGELADIADDPDWQESPLVVLEDGVPLPLPHALHEDIRRLGAGRYSCWGGEVLFSTPDGTDPNRNGRCYTLALTAAAGSRR